MLLVEARNQRDVAAAELARLVGLDPVTGRSNRPPTCERADPAPPSFDALTREGLAQRGRSARRSSCASRPPTSSAPPRQPASVRRLPWAAGSTTRGRIREDLSARRPLGRLVGRRRERHLVAVGRRPRRRRRRAGGRRRHGACAQRLREFDSVLAVEVRQRSLEIASGTRRGGRGRRSRARGGRGAPGRGRALPRRRDRAGRRARRRAGAAAGQLDRTRALASVRLAEARLDRAVGR